MCSVETKPEQLRGIIHCHSRYSYDSVLSISRYLRFARQQRLDFVVLTDHDTIAGSAALQRAAARRMPALEVPLAAEYLTDCGDVIAVFLKAELKSRRFEEMAEEARSQGALLLFPHPYVSHTRIDYLAEHTDLIEVFNARAGTADNAKASALAQGLKKPMYHGADAHLAASLGRAILTVEKHGDLRSSLLAGKIACTPERTPKWEKSVSQGIKAVKRRDAALAWKLAQGAARQLTKKIVG